MSSSPDDPQRAEPAPGAAPLPLVIGIGASAGGIRALKELFSHTAPDSGAAFVVILHLSPDHDSRLAEVLQSATAMPVAQVRDRAVIEPNHVYVIPPNGNLVMLDGAIVVAEAGPAAHRSPVDIFFRALADSHGPQAVAVVLSGTGPNGSNGVKRIKEYGGLTIAQDPAEAEFADMPSNSIATGLIDYVLPVSQIPGAIRDYEANVRAAAARPVLPAESLREILTLLKVRTGHDFSNYKPATVQRRIERRMAVHHKPNLNEYAALLRDTPDEPRLLMKEMLISVTNFFRDPAAYASLASRVVPKLFARKRSDDQVRAWIAGCATGEEAYSIAMLLAEAASAVSDPPTIQVFATDLDVAALAAAREGLYSTADVADVSEDRLRRFFQPTRGGYRVGRELRDLVLFAHHNMIRDPPFSHLDLIACRNVLIYLDRSVQERVLETFHFALRPSSYLLLGGSESADGSSDLFMLVDKSAHIYESRPVATRLLRAERGNIPPLPPARPERPTGSRQTDRIYPADLHQRLLEEYGAPSLVVTDEHQIVHVSERAARFLEMAPGEPSRDLRRLAVPEIRLDLLTALHQATRDRATVTVNRVRLSDARGGGLVRLVVKPVFRDGDPPRGYLLVVFEEEAAAAYLGSGVQLTSPTDAPLTELDEELTRVKAQLRATIEQYESEVEESKASNEELQAMNEELRSAAEELETGKEELQSVNEELTTVNQELKIKIEELGLTNNDFQNFINATDIATIFLDRSLRIKLSTVRAKDIFNLLPTDIGRKLSDITSVLTYTGVPSDIATVVERLQPVEREVETQGGRGYLMRILPYRTADDRIDGVVLTFVDISARLEAEQRVRASEERLRLLVDSATDYAIFTMKPDGTVDSWNSGAERMFWYPADGIMGRSASVLFTEEDRKAGVFEEEIRCAFLEGRATDERYHLRRDGSRFYCSGVTIRLGEGAALGFAKIARDLTAQREGEVALKEAHDTLEQRVRERTQELEAEVSRRTRAQSHIGNLLRKLVTSQEEQRARIARDLHDHVGQQLTALRLTIDRLAEHISAKAPVDEDMQRASDLAKEIDAELDFLAWELRPAVLDDLGLLAALPRFLEQWAQHYDIAAEFRSDGFSTGDIPADTEVTFYRVAQEALNNVVKHAHATRVDVMLECRDASVTLVIEDDGIGFDPADRVLVGRGMGLVGMRERAALSGATIEIESAPGKGTTVFLRCDIAVRAKGGTSS